MEAFDTPIITSITKPVIVTKAAHFKVGPCQWSSIRRWIADAYDVWDYIVVACNPTSQLERLHTRNPDLTIELCQQRIASQIPVEEKAHKAVDMVTWNDASLKSLKSQVQKVKKLRYELKRAVVARVGWRDNVVPHATFQNLGTFYSQIGRIRWKSSIYLCDCQHNYCPFSQQGTFHQCQVYQG